MIWNEQGVRLENPDQEHLKLYRSHTFGWMDLPYLREIAAKALAVSIQDDPACGVLADLYGTDEYRLCLNLDEVGKSNIRAARLNLILKSIDCVMEV